VRKQPLWGVWPDETVQVRVEGAVEVSALRANEAPYCNLHGMALSAGAHKLGTGLHSKAKLIKERTAWQADDKDKFPNLMEFQFIHDPSANLSNWFFTDIEKIVNEASRLNPRGSAEMMLPWEGFVTVGQNPKVGSSIKRTQHTQLCNTSLADYPVFQLANKPQVSARLGATVDLVDIGPVLRQASPPQPQQTGGEATGLFVKVHTKEPTSEPVVAFLVQLRKRLLERFGGANVVDFFVMCMADNAGGFLVVFACIPQLEKLGDEPNDFAMWKNPLTGESTEENGLHEARIDFGKGVGHFLVLKPAFKDQVAQGGEQIVRRIWAFNRVPGSRKVIDDFILEQEIFKA